MRIDSLVLVGVSLFGRSLSLVDALEAAHADGFDSVIAAPARPRDYALAPANDRLADAARGLTDVHRLARVDPNQGADAVAEVTRAIEQLRCVGVYLDPDEEVFRAQVAADVVREAHRLGVPVVISAGIPGRSEPLQVLDLARQVPEATIIMSSGGQINISGLSMIDAWFALTAHDRLFVLSNGEYRQDYLERVVRELGAHRLLFASSAPRYDQRFEARRIASARMSDVERRAVEGDNAASVFGLRPRSASSSVR